MLEHLDDPLQPPNSLVDPEFEDVRLRAAQRRRTQGAVAGVIVFSVLVTGGVSGLALGGPEVVHAPIGIGPLLAIGAPRSANGDLNPANLIASERTSPNACPSLAAAGRPTSSAAVAVAVTEAVVLPPENGSGGLGQAPVVGASLAKTAAAEVAPSAQQAAGGSSPSSHVPSVSSPGAPPTTGHGHPVPPSNNPPPVLVPPVVTVPPTVQPTDPPTIDPTVDPTLPATEPPSGGGGTLVDPLISDVAPGS